MSKQNNHSVTCETCKGFEEDIEKRKKEIQNLESNYSQHKGNSK